MAPDQPRLEPIGDQAITARLAGAGSMRADIEHVMAAVPTGATPDDYRRAIVDDNAARKRTGISRMWAWKRLKLRYALDQPEAIEFAAFRRAMHDPDPAGRGLSAMLMFARQDRLFREATLDILVPRLGRTGEVIPPALVREAVEARRRAAGLEWSDESLAAVANHTASSWKDFGLLLKARRRDRGDPAPAKPRHRAFRGRARQSGRSH